MILFHIQIMNFDLKAFHGTTPSDYSNSLFIQTLESLPEKIENLHGYVWNSSAIFVYWTPPDAPNGPDFVR